MTQYNNYQLETCLVLTSDIKNQTSGEYKMNSMRYNYKMNVPSLVGSFQDLVIYQ